MDTVRFIVALFVCNVLMFILIWKVLEKRFHSKLEDYRREDSSLYKLTRASILASLNKSKTKFMARRRIKVKED